MQVCAWPTLDSNAIMFAQDARMQGLAIGDCLELWATSDSPKGNPNARARRLASQNSGDAAQRLARTANAARWVRHIHAARMV